MGEACIKCGGTEHYGREVKAAGESIDLLPISFFWSAYLFVKVCGACGFVELTVPDRYLEKVREKFPPVP